MGLVIQLVSALLLVSGSQGQQGYGLSYPPQFFYLAPSDAAIVMAQHAQPTPKTLPVDAEEGETAQFHSQDGKGRAVFGYLSPDQSRVEERARDGSVRGAYSYLDPEGRAVKVQYWDNGAGFHSAGNNLPSVHLGLPQPVQDTPEVQLAREQHLHFYQQTLLHHQQQLEAAGHKGDSSSSDGSDQQAKPDRPLQSDEVDENNASVQQFLLEQQKHQEQQLKQLEALGALSDNALTQQALVQRPQYITGTASDSVVVESDNSNVQEDDTELTRYPNLDRFPQNLYDPSHIHDANRDAVIVESSESTDSATNSLRTGKSSNIDKKAESSEVVLHVDSGKKEDKIHQKSSEGGPIKPEDNSMLGQQGDKTMQPVKDRGFFYSFQHPIPVYVQVKTIAEDEDSGRSEIAPAESLSHSQQAAYFGAIPVAAVHDFQVPPWQKESFKNNDRPLYTAPIPERNPETNRPLTYSQKAHFFGAVPVAAVHDQQVHPKQRGSIPDHQTAPLYIETSVEDNK